MDKPVYALLESSLLHGGIKVKLNGSTCAQFPSLDLALNYLRNILKKEANDYPEVAFTNAEGITKIIKLF